MSYMIKGYLFNEDGTPYKLIDGLIVSGWDEAQQLLRNNNCEYYLFTLVPVSGEEE